MQRFDLGLLCMAVIALLIARRVIPFFTMRMVPGLQLPMNTRNGHVQIILGVLAILFGLLGQYPVIAAELAAPGLLSLFQVANWQPFASHHRPLLWTLYASYTSLVHGSLFATVILLYPT